MKKTGNSGVVFDIQKFTVHDGPGIRTNVFLKGCPLRCLWCSNPEGLKSKPQVGVYSKRCIGIDKCGLCLRVCPKAEEGALVIKDNRIDHINRNVCTSCLRCAEECPSQGTLKVWGREMSVSEVLEVVRADREFYEKSGGGITLSGGEVFLQTAFARELLEACKSEGINTCVESALHCDPNLLDIIYPQVDLVITDIKHMDSDVHKTLTGVGNTRILRNIMKTADMGLPLVIRVPVVAEHNNSEDNLRATAQFIATHLGNQVKQVQLLPYRELGLDKYEALGMTYPMADFTPPERSIWEENILHLLEIMQEYGIPAVAGTTKKYDI
ncbi:MAG: glycyl-radical enzyme activating protein [Pseudomonadota bacterium]|nr:glycyl-radical enzyme activating protein [Pseudomonadota bacterium]